ncbi:ATP-binding protein [Methylobacterium sp. J-070]|uniref:ATP-binding protein n=1 Tax=Methylobacterium sp. J-070 TaxID=2836650 RepID=UPI001FB9BFAA|nr:ATP-binding protein [Methylobacterium sp. J-070]MCJ2050264.1 ATP-binding protein [Methylobacterium sp. J-070]
MIKNLRKTTAAEAYLAGDDGNEEAHASGGSRQSPAQALGRLLLEGALTNATRRRLAGRNGLAMLLEAPTPAWVAPLRHALNSLGSWYHLESRDGTTRHKRKPDDGGDELTAMLAAGKRVAVICHAPDQHVPPAFIAAAEMRLRPGSPTDEIVRDAIEAVTGKAPRKLPDGVARLDLGDLQAAIRQGSTAAQCVRRLASACAYRFGAQADVGNVPDVRDLHGYGAAGEWAGRLVDDVNAWRADPLTTPWADIDAAVVWSGPPGVGKTSLAASVAKSCQLKLISTSVTDWFSGTGYLDSVIKNMHAAFDEAKAFAPCVLFF